MFRLAKRMAMFKSFVKCTITSYQKIKEKDIRIIAPNVYLKSNVKDCGAEDRPQSGRPLVVLMSWLRAKDKHLNLYNDFYTNRGFDVLTARVTAYDMFFPDHIGKWCLDALEKDLSHYHSIIIHTFSFGVYAFGTILLELEKRKTAGSHSPVVPNDQILENRIKGVILDSVVTADLILGLPQNLKSLPESYKFYMKSHQLFLKINKVTTNYLLSVNEVIYKRPLRAPALVLVSDSDPFGNVILSEKIVNIWRNKDIDVKYERWKKGAHVQLMKYNQNEYGHLIDELIHKTQIKKHN